MASILQSVYFVSDTIVDKLNGESVEDKNEPKRDEKSHIYLTTARTLNSNIRPLEELSNVMTCSS